MLGPYRSALGVPMSTGTRSGTLGQTSLGPMDYPTMLPAQALVDDGLLPVTALESHMVLGIWGAGVVFDEYTGDASPAVFIQSVLPDIVEVNDAPPQVADAVRGYLNELFRGEVESGTALVLLPTAQSLTAVSCSGNDGTLGARVTDRNGNEAFLTAGHVAPYAHLAVHDDTMALVGHVSETRSPDNGQPGDDCVDVAVISRHSAYPSTAGPAHATTAIAPTKRMDVTALTSNSTTTASWLKAVSANWVGPDPACGDWADVAVTRHAISIGGDSGSLVIAGTDGPVGHVVGGDPSSYTLVQDLSFQLKSTGATLR